MAFDQSTRNRLQKFVNDARNLLTEEFNRQLQATYGLDPKAGSVAAVDSLTHLDNRQRQTANVLRDTLAHYLATTHGKGEKDRTKQALSRIVREQAFTVLNRLAALRMAEARGFLLETIAKGYNAKGFQLYKQLAGSSLGETGEAYRNYLYSVFDEFSLDLAVLFDRHSAQGRLFPRESALLELLDLINHHEIEPLWAEDETIGWIYQYFNSQEERKKMRAESQAPRNSRELAVRNQFFTPRYVVEFLTDNTLGRIWYEMTQGKTSLIDSCSYLVRRPTEVFLKPGELAPEQEKAAGEAEALSQEKLLKQPVYIPHRAIKDPRCIRMLDPACGSMHFGLYAFDLYERIYEEAWQLEAEMGSEAFVREGDLKPLHLTYGSFEDFKAEIPRLIIEHNIHGVDIDPRAVQIAGLSLWQRAQRAWQQQGIKPQRRPVVRKSNIVCAEPMPGEKALLQEFSNSLNPPVLGQLLEAIFDKMELAGEAGTLLKIEEEIQSSIHEARDQWQARSGSNSVSDMFQAELDQATPQKKLGLDLSGVDDESFWDGAEQLILDALSNYSDKAEPSSDQKRLFAEDAAKGFAFIDLCRKRFDVVLMNPPFGEPTDLSLKWLNEKYKVAIRNLYIAFIERGKHISTEEGFVGAITDATFIHQNRYEKYRSSLVNTETRQLTNLIANGWGVLDAYVETACYIIGRNDNNTVFMVDLKESESKQEDLLEAIDKSRLLTTNENTSRYFPIAAFQNLPKNTLAFWLPTELLGLFATNPALDPTLLDARCGMSSSENGRFYKLWWEVPGDEIGKDKRWSFLSNGGNPAPLLRQQTYVVNFKDDGKETKTRVASLYGSASRTIINERYYRSSGFTYGKRTESISFQLLQEGHIFSNEGQAIFPYSGSKKENLLAYLNSSLISYALNSMAGQHKEAGYVGAMPTPPKKFLESDEVTRSVERGLCILHECYSRVPEYQYFVGPIHCDGDPKGIDELAERFLGYSEEFESLMISNDVALNSLFGKKNGRFDEFENRLWSLSKIVYDCDLASVKETICFDTIGYLVGCVFGRWDSVNTRSIPRCDIATLSAPLPQYPAAALGVKNGIVSIFESDKLGTCQLSAAVEELFVKFGWDKFGLQSEILGILREDRLDSILLKPTIFFENHLSRYSVSRRQAPIYWPLQTASGSYTLWVYYHQLNMQTLYTCVNNFVQPKLGQVEQDLNTLRGKQNRSSQEEKELEKLSDFASELIDFRDELLRLAKFWKPNLNDGVQITAAPLWRLFQHKAWQKKLKDTWESLEKGDYDWAHLACNIWPERVLRKCHQDRSLAIAHDVEKTFWHEVEVPVMRGRKPTGETKLEWQPKELTDNELDALIQAKIKEMRA